MSDREFKDGMPELSTVPLPIPELKPTASAMEIAKAYMAMALGYYTQLPKIVEAIHWLHGAVIGARSEAERARDISGDVKEAVLRLELAIEKIAIRVAPEVLEAKMRQVSSHELDQYAQEAAELGSRRDSDRVRSEVDRQIQLREGELAKKTLEEQRKTQRTIIAGVITSVILAILAFIAGRLLK